MDNNTDKENPQQQPNKEEGSDTAINCPSCGELWNISKHNSCQCGATLKEEWYNVEGDEPREKIEKYIHKGIEFSRSDAIKTTSESYRSGAGFGYSCGYQDGIKDSATSPSATSGKWVDLNPLYNYLVSNQQYEYAQQVRMVSESSGKEDIEFAEWCMENKFTETADGKEWFSLLSPNPKIFTTEELYNLFLSMPSLATQQLKNNRYE